MRAVILAAGRGSRMGALTNAAPKCLMTLGGRTLLDWQLAALRGAGIEAIGIVRGYQGGLFDDRGLVTFENERWSDTNMVASLACACAWLTDAPVIVSYSDIFYPAAAISALMVSRADITVAYDPEWLSLWSERFEDPLSDAETFRLDGQRVIDIGRRTTSLDDIGGQYMGLLKIAPAGWSAIEQFLATLVPERRDRLDMTGLLAALIARGQVVEGVPVPGPWGEADSASDLALYERLIAEGRLAMPGATASR